MSLRHALLGMLAMQPASGYDLAKQFEKSIGRYAWSARHNQIYTELNKLAEDGLVIAGEEGARGRRDYSLTPAGRAELEGFLAEGPLGALNTVRNKGLLRVFLITALAPEDAIRLLKREAEHNGRLAEQVAGEIHEIEELSGPGGAAFGRIAAELGRRYHGAVRDWAEWAVRELEETQRHE
ncbi:DNA-binding PadR family transcriptional regulator [Crossiella equi]|uniref:DNA-binding PadR family transcriptional regulator n=1 Tax=Crossiella equi TaxID=130796 RepID=A0ABS5A9F3_9PSEU|nr:PadR family transcriptional regulator [Crossiella equi]MBP2473205.1 DNA-binding PadR family transcriptional regulator [Crossiella equi]